MDDNALSQPLSTNSETRVGESKVNEAETIGHLLPDHIDKEDATPSDLYDAGLPKLAKRFSEARGHDELATLSDLVGTENSADPQAVMDAQIAPDERLGREPSGPGALDVPHVIVGPEGGVAKMEESSGSRWAALGQLEMETGIDARAVRVELLLPPEGSPIRPGTEIEDAQARKAASLIAQPRRPSKLQDRDLASWQRTQAWSRINGWLEAHGLIQIQADTETNLIGPVNSITITAMDEDLAWRFAKKGREELHYLSNLFSGGGYRPGTDKPDYRKLRYVALEPEHLSAVTEFLGLGKAVDPEADRELIIDGHSPMVLPGWPDDLNWLKDRQFRAITGHENLTGGEATEGELSLSKGVLRCIHPRFVERVLGLHEQGERVSEAAYEMVLEATKADRPTIFLAKGDQVKVGGQRMADEGEALVTSTFLRGSLGEEGEPPRRQFPGIDGGPQFAQFLTPAGFEMLLRHLKIEAKQLAEKIQSVEGIASLVSEKTAQERREIMMGRRTEVSARSNLLESAVAGGGILEQSDATLEKMEGQSPSSSNVFMLDTVKTRLDFTVASEARWVLSALGMEFIGALNFTCENSQALVRSIWHTDDVPEGYYQEGQLNPVESPVADPSGQVLPLKVIEPTGADDDGDIILGWAADTYVEGIGECKVVMNGRYPNVDAPVGWALPAGTETPFDARSAEQSQRFERMVQMYSPEAKSGEPSVESDGITRLALGNAYELSETGAKSNVDTRKAKGPATRESAVELVQKQAGLTEAGPRTRDLERFLHAAVEAKMASGASEGHDQRLEEAHRLALEKAADTAQSCEGVLTAYKHQNDEDRSAPPCDGLEVLGYVEREQLLEALPLDYHGEVEKVDSLLLQNARSGHCLQMWNGPSGQSRVAKAMRWLVQGPLQEVVERFEGIQTDPTPFVERLQDRAPSNPSEDTRREADFALRTFDWYRDFWSDLIEANEEAIKSALDREKARERVEERTSIASRQMSRLLDHLGGQISTDALALALSEDWEPRTYQVGPNKTDLYHPSKGAGMAMASSRLAGVFFEDVDVTELGSNERYAIVWRSGEDLPAEVGETAVVEDIGIDRDNRQLVLSGEEGLITLNVAEDSGLPPDAVASDNYKCRLTSLTSRRGVIRWLYNG